MVTAAADVERGKVLDEKMLRISNYKKDTVPKGALTKIEDAVNRTVIFPLVAGEVILAGKLAEKGAGRSLTAKIPAGMRAFTILTPQLAADVGGLLMPDDYVDVLLTTSPSNRDDRTGGGVTTTLLQRVKVLAIGQRLECRKTASRLPTT